MAWPVASVCRVARSILAVAAALAVGSGSPRGFSAERDDPFASHVRPTEPLTPAEERAGFTLPPGFVAELVASEDRIAKPMNIACDDRGRLWVTCSREYPFAAPADRDGQDFIQVFADRDGDGVWEESTTFADGLNIPIGLVPVADGVICFSIPNIWHLRDVDGDGRADERKVLYGPLGWKKDTHGMCNAFRRGPDGWIYACHGFNNESTVAGADGHAISMQSGNTFRFRADGSRIEHFTWGQVNPFGMDFDEHGDLFTADCHTKPVTLLLQEGRYESFGRPHDGLGFVPAVMDHLHGSTAIGGLAIYDDVRFPPAYRGNCFGGNVMTSRINRNRLVRDGATVRAVEEPDLLAAADPWFRPVDLRLGPDGALYVADFYNRIIGHYEVPLDHPGRDRTSGRIWRISYRGVDTPPTPPLATTRLDGLATDELVAVLRDTNRTRRELARERIVGGDAAAVAAPLAALAADPTAPAAARAAAGWCQARLGLLDAVGLGGLARDSDAVLRQHALRIAGSGLVADPAGLTALVGEALHDGDPLVRRAAAAAAARLPAAIDGGSGATLVAALTDAIRGAAPADVHLRHALRLALRSRLRDEPSLTAAVAAMAGSPGEEILAEVCLGLESAPAGDAIVGFLARGGVAGDDPGSRERLTALVQHAATHASTAGLGRLAAVVDRRFAADLPFQVRLLETVRATLARQGQRAAPAVVAWADAVARRLLELDEAGRPRAVAATIDWTVSPLPGRSGAGEPWPVRERPSADGGSGRFRVSMPRGEQSTGVLRSEPFAVGPALSFFLAGHDGSPDRGPQGKNLIRIRDAVTEEVLRTAAPPRNDTAQPVTWDTADIAGRRVVVEVIDGDDGGAYAWLAVGRFSDARLDPGGTDTGRQAAAALAAGFGLDGLAAPLALLLTDVPAATATRVAAAAALGALAPDARLDALALVFTLPNATDATRAEAGRLIASRAGDAGAPLVRDLLRTASAADQRELAVRLAADEGGCGVLGDAVEQGACSPRLLVDPAVASRLAGLRAGPLRERVERLAATAPADDAALAQLIDDRRQDYRRHGGDADAGKALFRKHCIQCHQVAGEGAKVGPQLDGIGNRGLDRVVEDVLDPNRNVDVAFRVTTILTTGGRVLAGIVTHETPDALVCVDQQGKEFAVARTEIDERRPSALSLMPANFHEAVPPDGMRDLLAYLLALRAEPAANAGP
ncbi:MAG: c-type cytochrome [Planctomycetes bacterium]|nr:c-type cytochrome [Planctomycetota bacterium]